MANGIWIDQTTYTADFNKWSNTSATGDYTMMQLDDYKWILQSGSNLGYAVCNMPLFYVIMIHGVIREVYQ